MDNLSRAISTYFESGIQLLSVGIVELVLESEGDGSSHMRDCDIPNFKINSLLYIFKSLNIIFHVNITFAQVLLPLPRKYLNAAC